MSLRAHRIDPEQAGNATDEYQDEYGFATRPSITRYDQRWRIQRWWMRMCTTILNIYQRYMCMSHGKWPPYSSIEEGENLDDQTKFQQTISTDAVIPAREWLSDRSALAVLLCDDEIAWQPMSETCAALDESYNLFTPGNAETLINETILDFCSKFPRRAVVIVTFGGKGESLLRILSALRDVENEIHVYTISTVFSPETIIQLRACQCYNIRYTFTTSLDQGNAVDQTITLPYIFEQSRHVYDFKLTFFDSLTHFSRLIVQDMAENVMAPEK